MEAEPLIKEENSKNFFMDNSNNHDDETHVVITGPPASRTVIDNLKKLLTQRQHSRESDAENKEVVPSTGSDLESELSFYSLLTSSTSDSDLDFLRTSPENRKSKRRPKRNLSTSSTSSSASLSPVRERRKRPKTSKRGVKKCYDSQMIILEDWNPNSNNKVPTKSHHLLHRHSPQLDTNGGGDPLTNTSNIVNINIMVNPSVKFDGVADNENHQNASSSNKDSSSDDESNHHHDDGSVNRDRGTRLRKTRRDRDRRRKHNYTDHGRCQSKQHPQQHNVSLSSSDSTTQTINGNTNIPSPKSTEEKIIIAPAAEQKTMSSSNSEDKSGVEAEQK